MGDFEDAEKREYKRFRLKFQVEIENLNNNKVLSLISRDLSIRGMGISKLAPEGMEIFTEEELLPDVPVKVKLLLPGCGDEIAFRGKVKWSERTKTGIWRVGIVFERPQKVIDKYNIKTGYGTKSEYDLKEYYCLFRIEVRKKGSSVFHIGLSANINNVGMQFFSDVLFHVNTPIEIQMYVFDTYKKRLIKGSVLWARQEEGEAFRVGVRFDNPISIEGLEQL